MIGRKIISMQSNTSQNLLCSSHVSAPSLRLAGRRCKPDSLTGFLSGHGRLPSWPLEIRRKTEGVTPRRRLISWSSWLGCS